MSMRRAFAFLVACAAVPAAAAAQDSTAAPTARLAVAIVEHADAPEFAAQRAGTVLQNLAEVVRRFGARVAQVDTVALGVTRLPEVNGVGGYPPPPYAARYELRVHLASARDVTHVSTALSAAGAAAVTRLR